MKKRTHYLIVTAVAALLVLAAAAPVVAHQLGTRGMSGTLALYNATPYHGDTIDPHGATGNLYFEMEAAPYSVKYVLRAQHLQSRTQFALVNYYCWNEDLKSHGVHVLAEARTSRYGSLFIKGSAGAAALEEYEPNPWFSGAQVGLVKSSSLNNIGEMVWVREGKTVLHALAGLPVVYWKAN